MKNTTLSFIFSISLIVLSSCKKDEKEKVIGCTDSVATNFNPDAEKNCDNCCEYTQMSTEDLLVGKRWNGSEFKTTKYDCSNPDSIIDAGDFVDVSHQGVYYEFYSNGTGIEYRGLLDSIDWSLSSNGDTLITGPSTSYVIKEIASNSMTWEYLNECCDSSFCTSDYAINLFEWKLTSE